MYSMAQRMKLELNTVEIRRKSKDIWEICKRKNYSEKVVRENNFLGLNENYYKENQMQMELK